MNLEQKRDNFLYNTLLEVSNSTQEILKIRSTERPLEFSFKFPQNNESFFQFHLNSSGGSVISGRLTIFKPGQQPQVFQVLPFPFLFIHEISVIYVSLKQQIKYVSSNRSRISIHEVDSLITAANQALSVLSNPKFTQIEIVDFIDPPLPQESSLIMNFNGSDITLASKSICGLPDGVCENIEDSTLLAVMDQLVKRIVESLRFLRTDIQTWGIQDDDTVI